MELQWIGYLKQSGWMDLLKIGGVAGIVSSVVSLVWSEVKDGRARKREARHVALTTALSLEQYACEARLMMHHADWAAHEAARTQSYDPLKKVALPEMTYPESMDWKWLKHKVTSRLREFPASLHSTRQCLYAEWEYGDPIEFCAEMEFESAKAAMQALDLSRMTRAAHGVAPWTPGAQDSDLEKELRQFIEDRRAKREKSQEARRQLMKICWRKKRFATTRAAISCKALVAELAILRRSLQSHPSCCGSWTTDGSKHVLRHVDDLDSEPRARSLLCG